MTCLDVKGVSMTWVQWSDVYLLTFTENEYCFVSACVREEQSGW